MSDHDKTQQISLHRVAYPDDLRDRAEFGDVYIFVRKLGQGGMGQCWLAEEYATPKRVGRNRAVVVKIVPPDVQNAEEEMERIEDVFYATEKLNHPNICPVYVLKRDQRYGHYLVMRYIDGQPLNKFRRELRKKQQITLNDAVKLFRPLAAGLDYAHCNQVIHRDIKPANVMVESESGTPYLIDFGLAAQIRTSVTRVSKAVTSQSGTLVYMSPEQWEGEPQREQTDQYALGVMVYEFLSGDVPFLSDNNDIMYRLVTQKPVPPVEGFSDSVNAALAKALAKERKERFSTCVEFIDALKAKPQVIAPPVLSGERAASRRRESAGDGSAAGERQALTIKGLEYAFRWCPSGTFMMGSPANEPDRYDNETQHQVTLSQGFWLLETQVTQEMWESVMGSNPSYFKGKNLPVEQVSWDDCQVFIEKLNALFSPVSEKRDGVFRLPTEAQWEYACRAGTTTPFHFGSVLNGDKANCDGNYPYGTATQGQYLQRTSSVGSYPANAWGLYDMHGNVWEWCADWYGAYPDGGATDPVGASNGSCRVLRGGGWSYYAGDCRSAYRGNLDPSRRYFLIGIRLSLVCD